MSRESLSNNNQKEAWETEKLNFKINFIGIA